MRRMTRRKLSYCIGLRKSKGIFSRVREYPLWNPQRTQGAPPLDPAIAGLGLEGGAQPVEWKYLRGGIASLAAIGSARRFASASIIRCRSADLAEVQPNPRLPRHPTLRRAKQCRIRHAVCRLATVTRASRSKARLRSVTTRRRFMAKPCTPHLHCAARAVIQE